MDPSFPEPHESSVPRGGLVLLQLWLPEPHPQACEPLPAGTPGTGTVPGHSTHKTSRMSQGADE